MNINDAIRMADGTVISKKKAVRDVSRAKRARRRTSTKSCQASMAKSGKAREKNSHENFLRNC